MFPAGAYDSATTKRIAMASHGLSVLQIQRQGKDGAWKRSSPRASSYNRRVTATTPFTVDGPAAGDVRLRTAADPSGRTVLGTLNNCSGGTTPWGTVLSGEENFSQYFDRSGASDSRYTASYARYGITGTGSRGWSEVDPRFDLTREPHEAFRFGWVIEIDPHDPSSTPAQAHDAGPLQARGRQHPDRRQRARGGPTSATTSAATTSTSSSRPTASTRATRRARTGGTCSCSPAARCTSPGSPATARLTDSTTAPASGFR